MDQERRGLWLAWGGARGDRFGGGGSRNHGGRSHKSDGYDRTTTLCDGRTAIRRLDEHDYHRPALLIDLASYSCVLS